MGIMKPCVTQEDFLAVDTTAGTDYIPADVPPVGSQLRPGTIYTGAGLLARLADYCEEGRPVSVEIITGKWWGHLSAPGYMDQTAWQGPYDSEEEAFAALASDFDLCPECGKDLDEDYACPSCSAEEADADA